MINWSQATILQTYAQRKTHTVQQIEVLGRYYVRKIIQKNSFKQREYETTQYVQQICPNGVVKLYDKFETETQKIMIFKFYEAGDLNQYIRNRNNYINVTLNYRICHQLLLSLTILHQNFIVHRDIKPGNIFVTQRNYFLIGDFGEAKKVPFDQDTFTHTIRYTPGYESPQIKLAVANYQKARVFLNPYKDDIWAMGRTLLEVCIGQVRIDYNSMSQVGLNRCIQERMQTYGYDQRFINIIKCMLDQNLMRRPSSLTLLREFEEAHFYEVSPSMIAQMPSNFASYSLNNLLLGLQSSIRNSQINLQLIQWIIYNIQQNQQTVAAQVIRGKCQRCFRRRTNIHFMQCEHKLCESCIQRTTINNETNQKQYSCPIDMYKTTTVTLLNFNRPSGWFRQELEEQYERQTFVFCPKCNLINGLKTDIAQNIICHNNICKKKFCNSCFKGWHYFGPCKSSKAIAACQQYQQI